MKSFSILVLSVAVITGCEIGRNIYRAKGKLLVTTAGPVMPAGGVIREDSDTFYGTLIDIMLSRTMLARVQQRMKKGADEIRDSLSDLKVYRVNGTDIIVVSVESRSPDFAKDFANTLMEEYLRFREEKHAQTSETVLLQLTREVNRLSQEMKSANERVLAYAKEHDVAPTNDVWELQLLREDRDRTRDLYNALLTQLMKVDVSQAFNVRTVSVLEAALLDAKPVHGWIR